MSGLLASAKPRRIKAAHRRRRKVASGHRRYANNNPYKFVDPDGQESACVSVGQDCLGGHLTSEQSDAIAGVMWDATSVVGLAGIGRAIVTRALVPAIFSLRGGTKAALDRLSRRAISTEGKSTGNINIRMPGGEAGWRSAQRELGKLTGKDYPTRTGGSVFKGTTRDGASVEIRSFSSDGSLTIKVQELGSHIKRMYRFEPKPK